MLSRMPTFSLAVAAVCLCLTASAKPLYQEAGAPIPERVQDLLNRMNVDELIHEVLAVCSHFFKLVMYCGRKPLMLFSLSLKNNSCGTKMEEIRTPELRRHVERVRSVD